MTTLFKWVDGPTVAIVTSYVVALVGGLSGNTAVCLIAAGMNVSNLIVLIANYINYIDENKRNQGKDVHHG